MGISVKNIVVRAWLDQCTIITEGGNDPRRGAILGKGSTNVGKHCSTFISPSTTMHLL